MQRKRDLRILTNNPRVLTLLGIAALSAVIAWGDYLTPPVVPLNALYAVTMWLALQSFGWPGGLCAATVSAGLFALSDYILHGNSDDLGSLLFGTSVSYVMYLLYCFAAYKFQANQRAVALARADLQSRLTEQTQLHAQAEQLHHQNIELAVLSERNRISREIHDVLAQGFTAILLQVEAATLDHIDNALVQERLAQIAALARDNLHEARRSVANLRPLPLDSHSLQEALQNRVAAFQSDQGTIASFTWSGTVHPLSTTVETALYRIAHEALTNAARHANAGTVQVALDYDEDEVCLTVQDDGRGFVVPGALRPGDSSHEGVERTFGLRSMQERASLIGGLVTIQSAPETGCRVRAIIPYHATDPAIDRMALNDSSLNSMVAPPGENVRLPVHVEA